MLRIYLKPEESAAYYVVNGDNNRKNRSVRYK